MKKLFQIGAVLSCLLITSYGFAQNFNNSQYQGSGSIASQENSCDQPTGDCWCMFVHQEPCYHQTRRCVEEKIPCKKTCCRYVDKYYEVQRVRYVPQCYTETLCQKVPEYYEEDDCKTCYKWVYDTHCTYKPRYYWKHVCQPQGGAAPGCASGCCGR